MATAPPSFSQQRLIRNGNYVANYVATSGVQTNVGDLMMIMSGNVVPVNQYPWTSGAELQSWSGARNSFLGVSLSQWDSVNVRSGNIRVAHDGHFAFPFPAVSGSTYVPGTFVSFTQDPCNGGVGSGFFQNQCLQQCSGQATGIGTIVEQITPSLSGQGQFLCYLQSTLALGTISRA